MNALEGDSANVRSVEMVCVAMNVNVIRLCAELCRETTRKMVPLAARRRKMSHGGPKARFFNIYVYVVYKEK